MKISVKVIPKASENNIEFDKENNLYKVKVTVSPEKGKANKKVLELLAKYFKAKKENVRMLSGKTFNRKIFEIK